MDHINSQLDQLSDLSDEDISDLQNSIVSEFDSVEQADPTPQTVDTMTSLADMLDTVRAEMNRRQAQAAELAAAAADAVARVKGVDPEDEEVDDDDPEGDDNSLSAEADADADAANDPDDVEAIQASAETVEEPTVFSEETPEAVTEPETELSTDETPAEDAPVAEAELAVEEETVETPTEEVTELASEETEASVEETEPEAELATEAPAEAAVETPVEAEASNTEETLDEPSAQEEAAPVTASADEPTFVAPADRRPVAQAIQAPVAITAGADIPGFSVGSKMNDMDEVAVAMSERIRATRRVNGGDGEQIIVASVTTEYPEGRILTADRDVNDRKIKDVVGAEALTASGGFAAPIEANYNIYGFGTDARPVLASLPAFQADRGGMRYITPPVLSSYSSAVGVWTNANDVSAAPPNSGDLAKAVMVVSSANENTAYTEAITLQLQFGNLLTRAFPELIARHNELALIQHARVAETQLLSAIASNSTAVTSSSVLGVARDFLVQVRRAAAGYRSVNRIDPATQLRAIIPSWLFDAIAADLALSMPGDSTLGVATSEISGYLAGSNVTFTASLDLNNFSAQSAGTAETFPHSFNWYLFSEGSFIFLDGGTLDIGIVRDSSLVSTNDYRMFTETFEGIAFVGIESLAFTSTLAVNGAAAALYDTTGTTSGGPTASSLNY